MVQSGKIDDFEIFSHLLTQGGDERIAIDPATGLNRYGYPCLPEPGVPAYGSSTASAISSLAFDSARDLYLRVFIQSAAEGRMDAYTHELDRMRNELRGFIGVSDIDIIFSDSGTTAHLLGVQLFVREDDEKLAVVMLSPAETGRGVPAALAGRYFSENAPLGAKVKAGGLLWAERDIETVSVMLRDGEGNPRHISDIDRDITAHISSLIDRGYRVILNSVDCSKTGMVAPGLSCISDLATRYGGRLVVMVDACQYRLSPSTLQAYLRQGYILALTGSKFMAGPSFSGALVVPAALSERVRNQSIPSALSHFSTRAEWPDGWRAQEQLPDRINPGVLLRWEAALSEMRAFSKLPEADVSGFFRAFSEKMSGRLHRDPAFTPIDVPQVNRQPLAGGAWDDCQTIFPFFLHRPDGTLLNRDEMKRIYDVAGRGDARNGIRKFRLGQPVECGQRQGVPLSALRLCMSGALAVDALSLEGRGQATIIAEAMSVLDDVARLTQIF